MSNARRVDSFAQYSQKKLKSSIIRTMQWKFTNLTGLNISQSKPDVDITHKTVEIKNYTIAQHR